MALAGIVILATATIYAYHTTQITLSKSGIVDAADASAYSAAVEGARHMNFIAYTNRAMVANAIAGGLLTTYSSWARNLSEVVAYVDTGGKGMFRQLGKVASDKMGKITCPYRSPDNYEEYAVTARDGSIDEDGQVSGGNDTHGAGECDGQSSANDGAAPIGSHYHTLGVRRDASQAEIRSAYRTKARELHPDRNPDRDTTAQFQAVQNAYEVLSDPARRSSYDSTLDSDSDSGSASGGSGGDEPLAIEPWKKKNKGPVSGTLDVAAKAIGYMAIPIDIMNGLYAASQWAVWGTANGDMEDIAREVAEAHDPGYTVSVDYPEETLLPDGFYSWVLPKRPGLDGSAEIAVPEIVAGGVGAFVREIPVLGGLIDAETSFTNHSTSLMDNYLRTAANKDAYYLFFARGWRFCALAGPVCAPMPLNWAVEHADSTSIKIGGSGTTRSRWKNETESRSSELTWQGSSAKELLKRHAQPLNDQPDGWRRVAGFPGVGGGVNQGGGLAALGLQRMLGEFGSVQALADAVSNTSAGQAYHFSELAGNMLSGNLGDKLSGMNWEATDEIRHGTFIMDWFTNEHFLGGFAGGIMPFYAFGKACFTPLKATCTQVGTTFAKGEANLRDEWYRYYQGVWSYFTLPSAPHLGIGPPEMWVEVGLEKTESGDPAIDMSSDLFGIDLNARTVDLKHASRAQIYYYRQPNSPYADELGAAAADRKDSSIFFLPSYIPPGDRPRHFAQPEDNQTASDIGLRAWAGGDTNQGSIPNDDTGPYTKGSYGLLENWFGKQLTWTFGSSIQRQFFPRDQGEFANVFAPFWEARLIKRE
ncbi:MAG: J domain-containing protein [Halofilum sp. (in: g-proteobacteria)]|nr:J domain-containing protein [Halofilum sp. (in: g-proteobacteria)]